MARSGQCIRIPDFHALTPWRTSFNPHFAEAAAASSAWALSFDIFNGPTSQKKLEIFQKNGGALLAAYVHPTAGAEGLRTACDFINLLYAIDELTDCQDTVETERTARIVIRAIQDEAYDDRTPLACMTRRYVYSRAWPRPRDYVDPYLVHSLITTLSPHALALHHVPM